MTNEIWKPISQNLYYLGVDDNYEVSNTGKVRNKKTGHILKITPINGDKRRMKVQVKCRGGYYYLSLQISHVVYDTFVGDCYGVHVKHKDGNPRNNAVENLYI